MLSMTRYTVKNDILTPWVKFIWSFEAEEADIHYKLLPTDCIDVILNLSSDMIYEVDSRSFSAAPYHINGLRGKHSYIQQTGNIKIIGISFYSFGLYPFVHKSLTEAQDKVVDLNDFSVSLTKGLESAIFGKTSTEDIINSIEKALCLELKVTEEYNNMADLINDFLERDSNETIQSFCFTHGVHPKTFMRKVLHYTGYTPKRLRSLNRFQKAGNQLVFEESNQLSAIAYENDFADQAHFIREFHKLSGVSPRSFQQGKASVKENVNYTHQ